MCSAVGQAEGRTLQTGAVGRGQSARWEGGLVHWEGLGPSLPGTHAGFTQGVVTLAVGEVTLATWVCNIRADTKCGTHELTRLDG